MRLTLEDIPLKYFLKLFNPKEHIQVIELGDTQHPSSGFVNERILGPIERVKQILEFGYEFEGLVYFEAHFKNLKVIYHNQAYELSGDKSSLDKIVSKIKMQNGQTDWWPKYKIRHLK